MNPRPQAGATLSTDFFTLTHCPPSTTQGYETMENKFNKINNYALTLIPLLDRPGCKTDLVVFICPMLYPPCFEVNGKHGSCQLRHPYHHPMSNCSVLTLAFPLSTYHGRAGYVGVVMPVLALLISTIFENLEWQ